jgi:hypothetical protein
MLSPPKSGDQESISVEYQGAWLNSESRKGNNKHEKCEELASSCSPESQKLSNRIV